MAKNAINILKEGKQSLDELNSKLSKTIENVLAINDAALKTSKNFFNVTTPQKLNESLNTNRGFVKQLNAEIQERQRLEKALERQLERNRQAETENAKALAKARFETQELNKRAKEAAVLSSKLSTEYQKQAVILTQLRRRYKDVALTQGESSKEAQKLLQRVTALDARLKRIDGNVGQFQRNVGNYGKAMRSAAAAARTLAGALGFTGGAFVAVQIIRDGFNRVREFDKAMQNLAGVLRTSRKDVANIESEIIKVSAASIKTSREVANLAESLATLGKRDQDLINLLKPANDLSIALETTSNEAAEFLVQTLNAFGAGSDEAAKYADVIATIRTSTTLDFQKMRDSFQYLTPISRVLNKDLAYTGAVIGILADNGLKAEQAGRLLGTAQQKLAKEGRSLAEALQEVNDAQARGVKEVELLKIASDLFGKQAAKVGIILAQNTDNIEINSQAIRENSGALDDLVNQQLQSLDAKLKIVDATWESFVLNIDNGNGFLGKAIKKILELTTAVIKLNDFILNSDGQERQNRIINDQYEKTKQLLDTQKQSVDVLESLLVINNRKLAQLKTEEKFDNPSKNRLEQIEKEQFQQIGIIKAIKEKIKARKKEEQAIIEEKNNLIKLILEKSKEFTLDELSLKTKLELNEIIKKLNKNRDKTQKALKFSIGYYEELIRKIKDEQTRLSTSTEKYKEYETQILAAQEAIRLLRGEIEKTDPGIKFDGDGLDQTNLIKSLELGFFSYQMEQEKKLKEQSIKDKIELDKKYAKERKDLEQDIFDNVIGFTNALFEGKVQKYDDEIQANNDKYAQILATEQLTEEQRSALEAERDLKNAQLEKKKREEQRKAAIFNKIASLATVAIQTSTAATAALAPPPVGLGPVLGGSLIPLIIANGALQAATILATPIPQYKKGKKKGQGNDSLALLNDGGKDELRISESGDIERIKGRNVLSYVKKSDTIVPDADKFLSSLSDQELYNNLHKYSIMASMQGQSQEINSYLIAQSINNQTNRMIKAIEKNKPNVKVYNNINNSLAEDIAFQLKLGKI